VISNIIYKLKHGKAIGLDSFTAEHLIYLSLMLRCQYVLNDFGLNKTWMTDGLNICLAQTSVALPKYNFIEGVWTLYPGSL